ncbi:MAG: hypothetical protein COA99_11625 [Moraxellaceae bacterium]|nr:MAG: hypothetical protein COA99_11625 [Moraxellaceae bacterium]
MKSWLVILIGLASTWHYMQLSSDSFFYSAVLPFLLFIFIMAAVIKIAVKLGSGGNGSGYGGDGGFGGGDSGGGGDC